MTQVELSESYSLVSLNCGHEKLLKIDQIKAIDGVVSVTEIGSYGSEALVIIDSERQQEIIKELSQEKYARPVQ